MPAGHENDDTLLIGALRQGPKKCRDWRGVKRVYKPDGCANWKDI